MRGEGGFAGFKLCFLFPGRQLVWRGNGNRHGYNESTVRFIIFCASRFHFLTKLSARRGRRHRNFMTRMMANERRLGVSSETTAHITLGHSGMLERK
jgi:hypothetical protein